MQDWIDYYRLLQVDRSVEPEVMEGAYKRLARKYHPDVNVSPGSESFMKLINEAYSVLSDPLKRKEYDSEWEKRHAGASSRNHPNGGMPVDFKSAGPARDILAGYFSAIMNKDFRQAYDMISTIDQSLIPFGEFFRWQNTVSKVFRLKQFDCEACHSESNVLIAGARFKEAVDFRVTVSEYNAVMDRVERDILNKRVILENKSWRVYMGYGDIRPFIERFDNLSELLTAKSMINEFVENYSRTDSQTGLLNAEGFMDLAVKETERAKRYGNRFTLMMIKLGAQNEGNVFWSTAGSEILAGLGRMLAGILRKLDTVARWDDSAFMILLPETGLGGAVSAARKVRAKINSVEFSHNGKECGLTASIGVSEFSGSLQETIRELQALTGKMGEIRKGRIPTARGGL